MSKNLPVATPETEPYWAGCRRHVLLIQRCGTCQSAQFYPRMLCSHCGGRTLDWVQASGRGRLTSFTIVRRPVSQDYAAAVPYVVALVQLEEGPTMMSNVEFCALESLAIGMPVEVIFDDWPEGVSIPKFMPSADWPPA
jgi:uncharacterized OB-fold protein